MNPEPNSYSSLRISSMEHIPEFQDVEMEILPLAAGGINVCLDFVVLGQCAVFKGDHHSRLWFQDIQSGNTVHIALMIPRGDPVRFVSQQIEMATLVSWHGLERQEYDYVMEPGTLVYLLELPASMLKDRGWLVPPPQILPVSKPRALEFTQGVDRVLDNCRLARHANPSETVSKLLRLVDRMTSGALYQLDSTRKPTQAFAAQTKIVRSVYNYLCSNGQNGEVTGEELSRSLGLPKRTVYAAFKEQLGIGPNQLHGLQRLYRFRSMLLHASPENETVSRLAHEAGFSHLGRTSAFYRSHFGENPKTTLNSKS